MEPPDFTGALYDEHTTLPSEEFDPNAEGMVKVDEKGRPLP